MLPPEGRRPASIAPLVSIAAGLVMAPFAVTTSSVALGAIRADLGPTLEGLQWLVSAFALSFAALLVPFGALADRHGRRRVFLAGVTAFALASALAGVAPTFGTLLFCRVLQGIGGALSAASGPAILADQYRHPAARKRAFGVLGAAVGVGLALGAVVGGPLVDAFGWRVAFFAELPLAALSWSCAQTIPESYGRVRAADYPGALACVVCLGSALAYATSGPGLGFGSLESLALLTAALLGFLAFVRIELRAREPLLDLRWFQNPEFTGVLLLCLSFTGVWVALFIYVPLYLQVVREYSASRAGSWMLLLLVPSAVLPPLAAQASRRHSVGLLLAAGSGWMSLGCVTAALAGAGPGPPLLLALGLVLCGVGAGFIHGLIDAVALSAVPEEQSGVASGAFNAVRLIGDAVGAVIPGAILAHAVALSLAGGPEPAGESELAPWARAASAVVSGDLQRGSAALGYPEPGRFAADARSSYHQAMQALFCVLALVSAGNALLCAALFRRTHALPCPPGADTRLPSEES